jgi:hypothetical protein
MAKVAAQSYSPRQIELINHAVSHNIDLLTLRSSAEWRDATKEHDAFIASQRKDFKAHDYLAHGNHGPFQSEQEKNAAYSHPLYATSEEYRIAVMHKTAQTPNSIMGLVVPKDPLSPEALMRAAQEDHYHAVRQDLFDKAGSKDQVVATRARLDILNLAQDPAYQEVMQAFERTEAET